MDITWDILLNNINTGKQDIDLQDFTVRANLDPDWDWEQVMIKMTANEALLLIHQGLT